MSDPADARSIFADALERPAAGRAAFLAGACANPGLRAEVERLLAAHDRAAGFLGGPAGGDTCTGGPAGPDPSTRPSGTMPWGAAPAEPDPGEAAGAVIAGRYKLAEPIGAGGMGTVWMARQTEPVRRLVAVKLIKRGMGSRAVLARFEAERQALALMDHPNIARVFEAGATADGRPFFVMELVKGAPITQYCDDAKLTPRQRLELFVPVCRALQHAHQKGVIHRDVKPSNVLVGLYDDRPVPKVIDFGIAKAAGEPLTDRTLETGFGAVVGTPQYMAPEQATLNNLDVDTRADVYGLGALLYELLTGSPPFTREELQKAALLEVLRAIREEEPPRPSTRVSTSAARPALAAARGTEPGRLTRLLRSDLDWVVMKALEKDRARRYDTAAAFAEDVERYLTGEPVRAAPPSALYRVRKFVRRHRPRVVAAALLAAALLAGSVGTLLGMVQAAREADTAQKAADRARTLNDQLRQLLESADPGATNGPNYTVAQLLDDYSGRLGAGLEGQPEVEAELRTTVGRVYLNLDRAEAAEGQFRSALALRRAAGTEPRALAASMLDVAEALLVQRSDRDDTRAEWGARCAEAHALADGALGMLRRAGGEPDEETARALVNQGWAGHLEEEMRLAGFTGRGEGPIRAGRDLAARRAGGRPSALVAQAEEHLAEVLCALGRPADAKAAGRAAVDGWRAARGDRHVTTAWARLILGGAHFRLGEHAEAEACFRAALARFRATYGDAPHRRTAYAVMNLVSALSVQFKDADADRVLAECPPGWRAAEYAFPCGPVTAGTRGHHCYNRGDYADAERYYQAGGTVRGILGTEWVAKTSGQFGPGLALAFQGKTAEAREKLAESRAAAHRVAAEAAPADGASDLIEHAEALLLSGVGPAGDPERAADLRAAVRLSGWELDRLAARPGAANGFALYLHLAARHRLGGPGDHEDVIARGPQALAGLDRWGLHARRDMMACLVGSLEARGLVREAEQHLRKAVDDGRATLPAGHPEVAARRVVLAAFLEKDGRDGEAESELVHALVLLAAHPQAAEPALARRRADVVARLAAITLRRAGHAFFPRSAP